MPDSETTVEAGATAPEGLDQRALDSGQLAFQGRMPASSLVEPRDLALAAAAAAGVYDPARDSAEEALERCIIVENLTEVIEKMAIHDEGTHGAAALAEYQDGFFDADGNRVGTVTGSARVLSMAPHMWQYHRSRTEFDGGTFETHGVVDGTAILHGYTQIFQLTGTSGRFSGKVGFMTLTIDDPTQRPPRYRTSFAMA
ncbi:hypothetical protein GCM10010503_54400 [Streptomyces lucensis JCM 4490]|uniref:Allene oxide cyclase barrel-like domain-containing protein n=1 Tax=Streptomyces lucensis JCM 4490 TaxID=1306176 RepID=A0A918JCE0_9ACTN|nr:hypothetical protein [Streptomyces lucensis]GGW70310.1 hypothetical protein GCM10010503_54400 [Streptomyces lucensis JCM 4490]